MHSTRDRPLRPVETEPGTLVHSSADRRLAIEHWLLSTLDASSHDRARVEWREQGVTLLRLGTLFSAVRIPERVVHAAARTDNGRMVDEFLAAALDDAPVIADHQGLRYYVLVPGSLPTMWHEAADAWRADLDVECLGREAYLGVPRVDAVVPDSQVRASYWAVPMSSAGMLCEPSAVARLLAAAARRLASEPEV